MKVFTLNDLSQMAPKTSKSEYGNRYGGQSGRTELIQNGSVKWSEEELNKREDNGDKYVRYLEEMVK